MIIMTKDMLHDKLLNRDEKRLDLSGHAFENMDLRGFDFNNTDLVEASFKYSDLEGTNFRGCNLTKVNFEGANLFCANLECAVVSGVIYNKDTRYFEMLCPREGAFTGFKKCFNFRIVQLLIPADARRLSATSNAVRCDKAKVLSIKSADLKKSFKNAFSYFDESFEYRVGEMVYADGFCEDRWNDSSQGIHLYLTREEALRYL